MPFQPPRPQGLDLYHAWISNPSRRVRFVLEEKGLPWRSIDIELLKFEQHSPEYVAVNPSGMVPALVHDGTSIAESTVICEYLEDAFPDAPPLRPADPRARARMRAWSKWVDEVAIRAFQVTSWNRLMGPTARGWSDAEVEERLKRIPNPERREDWRRVAREPFSDKEIAQGVANIRRTLERMEAALAHGPWLAGSDFSLADIHLSPFFARLNELRDRGIGLADVPRTAAWWERMQARPALARARIEPVFKD